MKENTKKWLVIAGLAVVCVLLVFGISRVLYKEPVQSLPKESKNEEGKELVIDDQSSGETDRTEEETGLVIDTEPEAEKIEDGQQAIQKEPEKTENEKPQEPPAPAEDADVTNPNTRPAYEEPEKTTPPTNDKSTADNTPKTGDAKDGLVYVEGFGWLTDEGEGSVINADDMYENGNKVGIMD